MGRPDPSQGKDWRGEKTDHYTGKHPNTGATPPTWTTHHVYVLHSQLHVAQSIGLLRTKRCVHRKQKGKNKCKSMTSLMIYKTTQKAGELYINMHTKHKNSATDYNR